MKNFLEQAILATCLLLAAVLGRATIAPVIDTCFVAGVCFLYGLGQSPSEWRWKAGPPALRLTSWLGYGVLLCHLDLAWSGSYRSEYLMPFGLLLLLLFKTTAWSLKHTVNLCCGHITDGSGEGAREAALGSIIRVIGLARGVCLVLSIWIVVALCMWATGRDVYGQQWFMLTLLSALALTEAMTGLIFAERNCSCCDSAASASTLNFARVIGLAIFASAWFGLLIPQWTYLVLGCLIFGLAVLSTGSPAAVPVLLRPFYGKEIEKIQRGVLPFLLREIGQEIEMLKSELKGVSGQVSQSAKACTVLTRDSLKTETLRIELGRDLLPLTSLLGDEDLIERLEKVRNQIHQELGLVVQEIAVKHNSELHPRSYRILLRQVEVAKAQVWPKLLFAIGPTEKLKRLMGERGFDPIYGMPGVWVDLLQKERASENGCMLFDGLSILSTDLTEVIRNHASELLGLEDVEMLLNELAKPILITATISKTITLVQLRDLLRSLLAERVSIRDLETILETLVTQSLETSSFQRLALVRVALKRQICQEYQNNEGAINVITLSPEIEQILTASIREEDGSQFLTLKLHRLTKILQAIDKVVESQTEKGLLPVLLCAPENREVLRKLIVRSLPNCTVLSWDEIADKVNVNSVNLVSLSDASDKYNLLD